MTITRFKDMHSGGGTKADYEYIYVEAVFQDAIDWFLREFDRDPRHTTCECCGQDFSIATYPSLQQATGRERHCDYVDGEYIDEPRDRVYSQYHSLDEWLDRSDVLYVESESV